MMNLRTRAYDTAVNLYVDALGLRDRALAAAGLALRYELRSCKLARDRLAEEIRRMTATPSGDERALTLFPGNVVRLHQEGVDHLGISAGDAVGVIFCPNGALSMQALKP